MTPRMICMVLVGLVACTRGDAPPAPESIAHLAVEGRGNANASMTAKDSLVVVAWSASTSNTTDVYTAVSRDAGRSFGSPVRVNDIAGDAKINSEFPPRVVIVGTEVVVVWTTKRGDENRIQSARSTDGGSTYTKAAPIPGGVARGNRGWQSVAVDSTGRVFVMWLDHRDVAPMAAEHHHGGASNMAMKEDPTERAGSSKLYITSLADSAPVVITGSVCYCCKTSLAIKGSSVYGVWRHVYPETHRNIAFARSTDHGKTFSAPVQVSEDHWKIDGCPENGPAIAVDDRIHVAWATPPDGKSDTPLGVFYAVSNDDGRTFDARLPMPTRGPGSHAQIVSEGMANVVVAWDEIVGTERRVGLARLTGQEKGPPSVERLWGNSPAVGGWPVLARAGRTTLVAWVSKSGSVSEIVVTPLR